MKAVYAIKLGHEDLLVENDVWDHIESIFY